MTSAIRIQNLRLIGLCAVQEVGNRPLTMCGTLFQCKYLGMQALVDFKSLHFLQSGLEAIKLMK